MDRNVTMGDQRWGSSHRNLQVERVENGYLVKAKFYVKRKSGSDTYDGSEFRDYVFYSDAEMLDWVKAYFEATPDQVGKGADS